MVVWGVISTATAAVNTFGGLLACRFFLGFVEAAYFVSWLGIGILWLATDTSSPDASTTSAAGTPEMSSA